MRLDAPLKTKEGARRDVPKPRIAAVAAAAMARKKEPKAAS